MFYNKYINSSLYFTNQNFYIFFLKKNIIIVFVFSISHKFDYMIEKSKIILHQIIKKMCKPEK